MDSKNNIYSPVPLGEHDQVSRMLLAWLNQFPEKPVKTINMGFMKSGVPDMSMSVIQGARKIKADILGGYTAEYSFNIVYQVQPDGNDSRLKPEELLNRLGAWAVSRPDKPALGDGIRCIQINVLNNAAFEERNINGDEYYRIPMTMTYEVIQKWQN